MTNTTDTSTSRSYADAARTIEVWAEGGPLGGFAQGIDRLALLSVLRGELDDAIAGEVAVSRRAGETWATIGDVLGLTRQGAQQRYS